ncbi:COX15/CtaA family protein [Candidatus Amarobacter glycogenicus]|jgi:heme A synthase|uniref:COX15/CtaA family protein n=1 Tax=Candidatus Amarobacter glycogenicus TaxID=3140699 RepID=UPI002A134652|nr:heme A synthase [Dehalococcoidia bacterium]MBK9545820.1 heme A synthase [Dehalococcoidia bacterium]MBK9613196.1 heme A synthase [Dehalococcoidia bacterium]
MVFARRLAVVTALSTLVLVGVGVLVRATGSGLGCPDWPLCHGGAVPPSHQESWIEFSHRFVAMLVGFLVIGVAICAWKFYRHVPFIVWVATLTVPLVGLQGLLGAITVVRELPPEIVATHLLTAMIVLSCEIAVAIAMYVEDPATQGASLGSRPGASAIGKLALASIVWMAFVLWIGGYMTESGAATSCEGWPLCNGSILPASDDHEVVHMAHRYLAGAFAFLIVPLVVTAWRRREEVRWAGAVAALAGVLYTAQVIVGALNVWYTFPDPLTISHTVIAASIWFTLSGAVALAYYSPAVARVPTPLTKAGAPA